MGTSDKHVGAKSPLVPDEADESVSPPSVVPDGDEDHADNGSDGGEELESPPKPYPPIKLMPEKARLSEARRIMTIATSTLDAKKLRCAVAEYVTACGGGQKAAKSMPNSQAVAVRIVDFARFIEQLGPEQAFLKYKLENMVGMPAEVVFRALIDMLCPDGGPIDDSVARQAMAIAISDLSEAGVGNFGEMPANELREFFISYVSRSIEIKIFNAIATNAVEASSDVSGVEQIEKWLHDFVIRCVRNRFDAHQIELAKIDENETNDCVNNLYSAVMVMIKQIGEEG